MTCRPDYITSGDSAAGRAIGPRATTSGRMDAYTPRMLEHGMKARIGKGLRNSG